jgi:hypothetical protein
MYGYGITPFKTPFLRDVKYYFSYTQGSDKKRLLKKLNDTDFDQIKNEKRFAVLINRATAMDD